jgi:hypothetical protein
MSGVVSMEITFTKILSLVIAAGYVLAAIAYAGWGAIQLGVALLLPLALIWFPEEIGSFTGYVGRGGMIDQETPPILVSVMGWFFLIGLPLILAYIWR